MGSQKKITVETFINQPIDKVWECWITPTDIVKWNTASVEWHTTKAENEFVIGGKFNYRMEAKDGSFGFDFWGIHKKIIQYHLIDSTLGDGRELTVIFEKTKDGTLIIESFEAETDNPIDFQKLGWQSILNNFKKYVEEKSTKLI